MPTLDGHARAKLELSGVRLPFRLFSYRGEPPISINQLQHEE